MSRILTGLLTPLAIALFWSGCATEPTVSKEVPAATPAPASTGNKHVMIFGHPPKQPYEELGVVRDMEVYHGEGENSVTFAINERANILDVLREKAAALGADAVILKEENVVDPDADPNTVTSSTHIWLSGMAIRFTEPPPAAAPH